MSMALTPNPGAPSAPGVPAGSSHPAADIVVNGSTATFVEDVIEASMTQPVVVDFWAPWCGPCKTLGPIIEKVVRETKGAVKLVKIDIDQNPELASQLRIQSIPAVYAFSGGRPVDGFVGALPESQVKAFVQRLPAGGRTGYRHRGRARRSQGDARCGRRRFGARSLSKHHGRGPRQRPGRAPARWGAASAEARRRGQEIAGDQCRPSRPSMPISSPCAPRSSSPSRPARPGRPASWKPSVAANPNDHQSRFDLAMAQFAGGQREEAIDELLEMFRRNRAWNEDAARKQLVKFFEAMGPTDPLTVGGRKRLSSLLFA